MGAKISFIGSCSIYIKPRIFVRVSESPVVWRSQLYRVWTSINLKQTIVLRYRTKCAESYPDLRRAKQDLFFCFWTLCNLMMSHGCCFVFSLDRMDTTEQCNAVISHFNGKFIKIGSGALGRKTFPLTAHFSCYHEKLWRWWRSIVDWLSICRRFSLLRSQLLLSPCCVSLRTVKGRNTLTADLFPMDRQGISD